MDWQGVLGAAGVIFTLMSGAGLGLMQGTLSNLRKSNEDLRLRVTDLEKEREERKVKETEMVGEMARLRDHEEYLQQVIRGKADVTALSDQLDDIHRIVVQINNRGAD